MNTAILNKLDAIEKENNIKILFACESGSRGWEFPSPDSDYDIRFIYARPYKSYLSITAPEDNLSFPINDELDIYGWDLRKVLQLIAKSNTTPFEWLQSPIVYRAEDGFRDDLWSLCSYYFSRRSNIHHYLGIAKGALDTMTDDGEIKIKKLFYILRPLLAAKWCLEKNSIAPMTIGPLLTLMPDDLRKTITDLINLKATAAESFMLCIDPTLKAYIASEYAACTEASKEYPRNSFDITALNDYFIKTITHYDHT